jgi:hypothetical protein
MTPTSPHGNAPPQAHPASGRIGVVSIASGDGFRANVARCIESQERYCKRNGYANIHFTSFDTKGRPAPWGKVLALQQAIREHPELDYFLWIDADALITNPFFRLEALCDRLDHAKRHMIVAVDGGGNINLGVFMVRRGPQSDLILENLWKQEHFINHCWWENGAIYALYPYIFQAMLVTRENNLFNAFMTGESPWRFGDFVLHFAGLNGDARRVLSELFYRLVTVSEPLLPRP